MVVLHLGVDGHRRGIDIAAYLVVSRSSKPGVAGI
tara:strand:- start:15052 stop:15156 length:105 start_codon:yes stop_codon:yes gene_type:complete